MDIIRQLAGKARGKTMPIYTYRCESCGVQFDRHQKFEDQPLRRCPECNKKALRKVIGPMGIVFKGSGFYATDNRSPSGGQSRASAEKADKSEKTEKAEKSTDAASGTGTGSREAAAAESKAEAGTGTKKSE
jgi:putative FmdB family regulatory protein